MNTAYILLGVGAVFLAAAVIRLARDHGRLQPQPRTWLLIAGIFTAVATWLLTTQ